MILHRNFLDIGIFWKCWNIGEKKYEHTFFSTSWKCWNISEKLGKEWNLGILKYLEKKKSEWNIRKDIEFGNTLE